MVDVFDRHFVRYSDYAALEAKLAEKEAENEQLEKERDYWQSQHDERTRQLGMSDTDATPPAPKVTAPRLTHEQKLIAEAIASHFGERGENYDEYEGDTTVDDVWDAFDALTAAPKVAEAMVETEMVRMTVSETIRAMGENPDEQLIGELTVFDAVAAKVRSALTAAQEAGKP